MQTDLFSNNDTLTRLDKIEKLSELNLKPYPHNFFRKDFSTDITNTYEETLEPGEKKTDTSFDVIGRIKLLRGQGNSGFCQIEDEKGTIQIFASKKELQDKYLIFKKGLDLGDIIQVKGFVFKTKTGETTIFAQDLNLVTKSLSPLPEKFHGLKDAETKYRKRYLDMISNPEVKNTMVTRSKIISIIRRYFEDLDFLEVETPILNPIPGGANAKPFVTHHNAMNVERYLRIAPELYLKRLVVGGMERIFEIGKNFRNEGVDHTHNPEFTSIECYWAFQNYEGLIQSIKELLGQLQTKLYIGDIVEYNDMQIDLTDIVTYTYAESISIVGGVSSAIVEDNEKIIEFCESKNIEIHPNLNRGQLLEVLFDEFVEEKLINPTFIIDYPIEISPLSRRRDDNPDIAERFELFVGGHELANGFNELNDPMDQFERFQQQANIHDEDDEAMRLDSDFIEALKTGLPPTAGFGLGIDRLVMILTNNSSIKDVIAFPAMK